MGIEFWIVPVIAAAVFILGSLMRGKEEDRKGKVTKALAEFAADQPPRPLSGRIASAPSDG